MQDPVVSIICISYQHAPFLKEALHSACHQTYPNVEVIAIDDASIDGSQALLQRLSEVLGFQLIINESNLGNCATFNRALEVAKGDYIIDLAGDDVLEPERVRAGLKVFKTNGAQLGVHYCDHQWIDESGRPLGYHHKRNSKGEIVEIPPSGDIYCEVLERYFISAPTMMIKREVLTELGGYDEMLSYEDFDFWVRSSRNWKYLFTDEVLVKKRRVSGSLASEQFRFASSHDRSTYEVCQKALNLNRSNRENEALARRVRYELKHAIVNGNLRLANDYRSLLCRIKRLDR